MGKIKIPYIKIPGGGPASSPGGAAVGDALWRQIRAEKKKRDYVFWTFILLCIFYLAVSLVFGDMGYLRLRTLKARGRALKARVAEVRQENGRISASIKRFQGDEFYQEKRAREELGLAKKNEFIFIFNGPEQ
ncbi:MAG: septum formation initiator family protein [Nitrospiraceae bacterium]|nr:septum formation initiator family protein [Nitrospiraceae bacterium]MDA8325631.1 septum formation initiator family protein [Nitrospiraceae bacterium]